MTKRKTSNLLVVLSSHLKLAQEDVGVPQVTVSSSLGRSVSKLLSDEEAL